MKRKLFGIMIAFIAVIACALCFVACGTGSSGGRKKPIDPDEPNTPASHTHSYENYVYNNDATCVDDGTETAHCTFNGCTETDTRTKAGTATGVHSYGEYIYNNDATCVDDGTETATCNVCHATDTRESEAHPATGEHTYLNHLCSICGLFDQSIPFTSGLQYTEIDDGNGGVGYSVSKGTATDSDIIKIRAEYNGKPVTYIEENAFRDCVNLTRIEITSSVTRIGSNAFYGCEKLSEITIPSSVTSIESCLFFDCNELTKISVQKGNAKYYGDNNCIIDRETKTIVAGCKTSVIPTDGSVTNIGDYAFAGCRNLARVSIPNSVIGIADGAFSGCRNLENIAIPSSVASVGYKAFFRCDRATQTDGGVVYADKWAVGCDTAATSIVLRDNTVGIADSAFLICDVLVSVVIPRSVTHICEGAFGSCYALARITVESGNTKYRSAGNCIIETASGTLVVGCKNSAIPTDGSVTSIGDRAFWYCRLTQISIPSSVTRIGNESFQGCSNLTSVSISDSVTSIGDWAFCNCSKLESITLPSSLARIGSAAFWGCEGLTDIEIPISVVSIGKHAFAFCDDLACVTFIDPNGWRYSDSITVASGTAISNAALSDPFTAARLITSDYFRYYWHKQ